MLINDLLKPLDYNGNKGLQWIVSNVFPKYTALLSKMSYHTNLKEDVEELSRLLAIRSYCALIVADSLNPYLLDRQYETLALKWEFKKFRYCFTKVGLDFDSWLDALGIKPSIIPTTVPIYALYGYFNYASPINVESNEFEILAQEAVGLYLLDSL